MSDESAAAAGASTSTRKRDAAATRKALLMAARLRFGQDGYEHTTVRDVAADVGVNQALVFRYFGSKDRLFEEAAEAPNPMTEIADTPLNEVSDTLLRFMLEQPQDFEGPHPLLALLRSTGHEEARDRLRGELCGEFTEKFAQRLSSSEPEIRAELFAAWMLGIGVLRSVIGAPALNEATYDQMRGPFRDGVHALLGLSTEKDDSDSGS